MSHEMEHRQWGRYELVAHLGKGGMGDVYKAFDPNLNRYVALKILRHQDAEVVQRFIQEARAQAKVEHRYVCKIYESGEFDNHPYIAMQYIEGKTLNEMKDQLNLEEKVRVVKNIALGLHAAHSQGLIHRDIKPTNIMMNLNEEERWKPYVMDFGIAREQEAPGLTSTGMVIGTPFYMSPEQSRGKLNSVDRRSDVYSLGITMYELFSGRVPFQGDTPVQVIMELLEKDPLPLRKANPKIPVDVETIVMRCIEKDPNRRYNSAKELAEDLQRYLDGDPIQARPATLTYRIKRKLSKHKWPTIAIGIASIIIVVLIGLWIQAKVTESKRALIAQELGQEVEKIESTIRYAHLLPLHDITREKDIIRDRISTIEDKMKKVGKVGKGPGNYAMGRGYMALNDYNKAREYLDKAWESGFQTPEVAYQLGFAFGELFLKETEKASRIESKEIREARKKEIENSLREPAVRFLKQGAASQTESKEFIDALIAFYEQKYDTALKTLSPAIQKIKDDSSFMCDIKMLEGNIYYAQGIDIPNYSNALTFYQKAEDVYQQVIKTGQSDIRGYIGLLRVLERRVMIELLSKSQDWQPLVEKAIGLSQKALQVDPGMSDVFVLQSSLYHWLGRFEMISGKDPTRSFNQSIDAAGFAINLQPDNFEAYTYIGSSNNYKAEYTMNHGGDPTPLFREAADSFGKAIHVNPNFSMAYNGMGNVYLRMAEYERSHGKDPIDSLMNAISTFEKGLAINRMIVNLHNGLAGAYWSHAQALMNKGQDPRPSFMQAVKSLENAIGINPGFYHFYSNLGFVYMAIAQYELDNGLEPIPTVKKAGEYFEKAITINSRGNELYMGVVSNIRIRIEYEYMMRRNFDMYISRANDFFKKGVEANPTDALLYMHMGANLLMQARNRMENNLSPNQVLDQADELIRKAKEFNPKYYEIYVWEAESFMIKAGWSIAGNKKPEPFFMKAAQALNQAIELNPGDIQAHLVQARLAWEQTDWSFYTGSAPIKHIENGLESIRQAISINPGFGESYVLKGVLLKLRSKAEKDSTLRLSFETEANTAYKKGIAINKNLVPLFTRFFGSI